MISQSHIRHLITEGFKGEIWHEPHKLLLYATDASIYKITPLLVTFPTNKDDIKILIHWANKYNYPIIPRGTGTSLAGQVVGKAVIADISKHFSKIIEINTPKKYAIVEPGVIRDELNNKLKQYNLIFGPETSTSNRATIGGMFGNNSSGLRSLRLGTTRQKILSVKVILSNGEEAEFYPLSKEEFAQKIRLNTLEGNIYRKFYSILSKDDIQQEIQLNYPDKSLHRRNSGYPLDELADSEIFSDSSTKQFNIAKFLCGSEGTLAFAYQIKVQLDELPPENKLLIASQFDDFDKIFEANLELLKFNPFAIELMDDQIIRLAEQNINQRKNRFFIKGYPQAVLLTEIAHKNKKELYELADTIISHLKNKNLGYFHIVLEENDISKAWNLRKAGLGVLSNQKGSAKPIGFIEDTAIPPQKLRAFVADIKTMLAKYNINCVYYAHIGSGELHLRPILDIKKQEGIQTMRQVAIETAKIVKKYNGSLSGEHGDGLLRSEFIPLMLGDKLYSVLKEIKHTWDPNNIFNPGKIIDAQSMTENLRYSNYNPVKINTVFQYPTTGNLLLTAEKCNGSADCRKNIESGGVMCPTYMATGDEYFTTRARANTIREYLSQAPFSKDKLKKLIDILSNCLSCKSCKSECPSGVDITKMKADIYQIYYNKFHAPIRNIMIAQMAKSYKLASAIPAVYNLIIKSPFSSIIKKIIKFAPQRELPTISNPTWHKWLKKNNIIKENKQSTKVLLFVDEFTNYLDAHIGIAATKLLHKLGYPIYYTKPLISGRTYLSKGFVKKAKAIAIHNIDYLYKFVEQGYTIIGIEPSTILTLRDEYLDLTNEETHKKAEKIKNNSFTIDEFLYFEMKAGKISSNLFSSQPMEILLHTHCYQKVLSNPIYTKEILSLPVGTKVKMVNSGCCGMAGSFGYEKEHYDLSMKIGELSLFPEIRKQESTTIIAAPGTSCRSQIHHGTHRKALHPVEILNMLCNI